MKKELRDRFPAFTEQFEGRIPYMYLDILGLVTTGVGNLIDDKSSDPPGRVFDMAWRFRHGGQLAGHDAVAAEWRRIKTAPGLARLGHKAAEKIATLCLADSDITALVHAKMADNHEVMKRRWPTIDEWPIDAQVAIHSMAWAAGPHVFRRFPRFSLACDVRDWAAAAVECRLEDSNNAGLVPRNAANKVLFLASATPATLIAPSTPNVQQPAARGSGSWLEWLIRFLGKKPA